MQRAIGLSQQIDRGELQPHKLQQATALSQRTQHPAPLVGVWKNLLVQMLEKAAQHVPRVCYDSGR